MISIVAQTIWINVNIYRELVGSSLALTLDEESTDSCNQDAGALTFEEASCTSCIEDETYIDASTSLVSGIADDTFEGGHNFEVPGASCSRESLEDNNLNETAVVRSQESYRVLVLETAHVARVHFEARNNSFHLVRF